ncbi:hypothetical protein [Arthrobacter antioxidans]|uniref:hypothetical protein n=1 Tax=Arthrobacter antioxidans TaxID=2895818 RepID=UPI001FFED63E|nr:hypothetical protein [Arthrobacter antioxidans]
MRNYEVTLDGEGLRTGPMRSQNPIGARAQERGTADQSFEVRNDGPVTDLVWVVEPSR